MQHAEWINNEWSTRVVTGSAKTDFSDTVFHQVNKSAVARRAAFEAIDVPSGHRADVTSIETSQRRIEALSRAAMVEVERIRRPPPGTMATIREIYDENKRMSERLVSLGASMPKQRKTEFNTGPTLENICPL